MLPNDTDGAENAPEQALDPNGEPPVDAAPPEDDDTVYVATTPIGRAIEGMCNAIVGLAANAGIGLTAKQMTDLARARDRADEAGRGLAVLRSAKSFDHDGDGKPGGSKKRIIPGK